MKRFVCLLLVLFLAPVCAFADTVSEFNIYAETFNITQLDESNLTIKDNYKQYKAGLCYVIFEGEDSIYVRGTGEDFILYGITALMSFEESATALRENAGNFLYYYFVIRAGITYEQVMETVSGAKFIIMKDGDNYILSLSKGE